MSLTPLLLTLVVQTPAPTDPGPLVKALRAEQTEARTKAYKKEPVDLPAVEADVKAKAEAAVVGIDPTKLPPEEADDWSALYRLAGHPQEAIALSERALSYHAMKAWEQQQSLLAAYIDHGDKPKILESLAYAQGTSATMLGQLGESVVFGITGKYGESDPAFALQAYDTLMRRFDLARPMSDGERSWTRFALARLGSNRDALLYKTGRQADALADLRRLRLLVAGDPRAVSAVEEVSSQLSTTGKPAPEIVAERQIGTYKGLAALRGKVVLVDFFAHWCGPCKRAFPDMRALYAVAKPKGLEVVGVTSLQGYYGDQQGVRPDAEFALMRDRFVPEFKLPWPVVFERGKAASKAYGVSGIPQLVVIDRAGRVRRIVVGYTPDEFTQTKALVARLLAESEPKPKVAAK